MQDQINFLEISNFKSIRYLDLDCKRVNVFIGPPNVGKSNILEALALYSVDYQSGEDRYLHNFVRYDEPDNLFYERKVALPFYVNCNWGVSGMLHFQDRFWAFRTQVSQPRGIPLELTPRGNDIRIGVGMGHLSGSFNQGSIRYGENGLIANPKPSQLHRIKKYDFVSLKEFTQKSTTFLYPPHGINLPWVLGAHPELSKEAAAFFKSQGLRLALRLHENQLEVQKDTDELAVTVYPYWLMADTFRRMIFYLAAIETNKNSVLVLEEPEVHSFPPYVGMLADRIVADTENQYFISTHNQYLLQTLLEKVPFPDLNVVIVRYADHQAQVQPLTEAQLAEVLDLGIDLFYNLDRFAPNGKV
jgi:hypothetical protein